MYTACTPPTHRCLPRHADGRYQQLLSLDGTPDAAARASAAQLQPLLAAAIGEQPRGGASCTWMDRGIQHQAAANHWLQQQPQACLKPHSTGDLACLGTSVEELAALLRKEQLNSYGIMLPPGPGGARRLRGGGIYPRCSLINHECIPNAARFDDFDGAAPAGATAAAAAAAAAQAAAAGGVSSGYPANTVVSIRAMHDLPAGTEVVQSYFPLNWDLAERRQQARGVYGFDCACPRCLTEAAPGWGGSDGSGSEWETEEGGSEEEMDEASEEQQHHHHHEHTATQHAQHGGTQQDASGGACAASGSGGGGGGDDRGPLDPTYLQLFMLKYMCPGESCFGTMAAVAGSDACECNVCGRRRTEAEFLAELE